MRTNCPDFFINAYKNSPEKVCIVYPDNNISWVNPAFEKFMTHINANYSEHTRIESILELLKIHMQEDDFIIDNIKEGLEHARVNESNCFTYEFPIYTLSESIWLMLVACYNLDEATGQQYIVMKFYDITEHYNMRKLDNKKDDNNIVRQIIGESMHTWRQPLNSISLFAQDTKEQFDDSTLTKYYMNFAVKQIHGEIKRLSDSIDEMAAFYTNDTYEDTINIAESMFYVIKKIEKTLKNSNTTINMNCHALGNIVSENYIQLADNFTVRCGTGAKKCFHGCNKGNVVVYGDRILYLYIIRSLATLGTTNDTAKDIFFELTIEDGQLKVKIHYGFTPANSKDTLNFIQALFANNFKGKMDISYPEKMLEVVLSFAHFKAKNPI